MDARELKAKASSSIAKGRFDRAEVLYRQALTLVPRDSQLWLKHGETLKQLGQQGDAVESYRMASSILATDGHFLRAIVAMKLALELRPNDVELISDVIRLEMRFSQHRDRPFFISLYTSIETPAPLLALPMIMTAVPEVPKALTVEGELAPQNNDQPAMTVSAELAAAYPQVRRLSDSEVAMRANAGSKWVLVSSVTPVVVRYATELDAEDTATLANERRPLVPHAEASQQETSDAFLTAD